MRKQSLVKIFALTMGIVVLATTVTEAQRRGRRGGRGRSGGRFGFNPTGVLQNEYLQKELNFTSAQKKRVREISIQMMGTSRALRDEKISQELGISSSQKEKLEKVADGSRDKFRELFRRGDNGERPSFDEIRKKMTEIRAGIEKEMLGVLTKSQQAKFEKMKGKPFDVSKLRGERGGRDGRRPRGKRPPTQPDI